MTKINDGGSAFPLVGHPTPEGGFLFSRGMTLRDWFAGQALAGLAAHYGTPDGAAVDGLPKRAFRIADALLAERSKAGGEQL